MRTEYVSKVPLNGTTSKTYVIIGLSENDYIIDGKVGRYKTVEEAKNFIDNHHKDVNDFIAKLFA